MRCISQYVKTAVNAGPKAKIDVEKILKDEYNSKIITISAYDKDKNFLFDRIKYKLEKLIYFIFLSKSDDLTIIQFPFSDKEEMIKNLKNRVFFIHDLDGLRYNDPKKTETEINILKKGKYIVCHNEKMKSFLINKGINRQKILVLGLFDYLCKNYKLDCRNKKRKEINVVYTGNLIKSPFIYQIDSKKMKFNLKLAGNANNELKTDEKIEYIGSFSPDDVPGVISKIGDLGLVWDGNFDESDENEGFKNYTKYNNPHKFSCYMAAGIPTIVWKKSAIAEFVDKYNVGYTIRNIYDINNIDFSDYNEKKENVINISNKIRTGYYTKKVISKIIEKNND